MIGSAFRQLAAANQMHIEHGVAYGMLSGCFVTLSEGAGYKRMSIYVGGQEAANGDQPPQCLVNAKQIGDMIAAASGEQNVYRLMTKHRNIPALVLNHSGSVLTINFFDNPGTMDCINRFVQEMLPLISQRTCPRQCLCCCQDGTDTAVPVMVASDTVVPMHPQCLEQAIALHDQRHGKPRGKMASAILGAAVASVVGALLWAVVYNLGYMAGLVAFLIAMVTSTVYDRLGGAPGGKKLLTVSAATLLAVVLGQFLGMTWPMHQTYQAYGSVVHGKMSEFVFLKHEWSRLLTDAAAQAERSAMVKDMLLGLIFGGVGCMNLLRSILSGSADNIRPRAMTSWRKN